MVRSPTSPQPRDAVDEPPADASATSPTPPRYLQAAGRGSARSPPQLFGRQRVAAASQRPAGGGGGEPLPRPAAVMASPASSVGSSASWMMNLRRSMSADETLSDLSVMLLDQAVSDVDNSSPSSTSSNSDSSTSDYEAQDIVDGGNSNGDDDWRARTPPDSPTTPTPQRPPRVPGVMPYTRVSRYAGPSFGRAPPPPPAPPSVGSESPLRKQIRMSHRILRRGSNSSTRSGSSASTDQPPRSESPAERGPSSWRRRGRRARPDLSISTHRLHSPLVKPDELGTQFIDSLSNERKGDSDSGDESDVESATGDEVTPKLRAHRRLDSHDDEQRVSRVRDILFKTFTPATQGSRRLPTTPLSQPIKKDKPKGLRKKKKKRRGKDGKSKAGPGRRRRATVSGSTAGSALAQRRAQAQQLLGVLGRGQGPVRARPPPLHASSSVEPEERQVRRKPKTAPPVREDEALTPLSPQSTRRVKKRHKKPKRAPRTKPAASPPSAGSLLPRPVRRGRRGKMDSPLTGGGVLSNVSSRKRLQAQSRERTRRSSLTRVQAEAVRQLVAQPESLVRSPVSGLGPSSSPHAMPSPSPQSFRHRKQASTMTPSMTMRLPPSVGVAAATPPPRILSKLAAYSTSKVSRDSGSDSDVAKHPPPRVPDSVLADAIQLAMQDVIDWTSADEHEGRRPVMPRSQSWDADDPEDLDEAGEPLHNSSS